MTQPRFQVLLGVAAAILAAGPPGAAAQDEAQWRTPPARWLDETPRTEQRRPTVPEYLEEMAWRPLDQDVLLFAGSATAWRWNDRKWFSDFRTANRGFGGARIDDVTHFADRLLTPYRPSTIVLYAGDNDLWQGKPPDVTAAHFADFVETVRAALPETQIVFVSIRPSPARWAIRDAVAEANRLIRRQVDADPNLHYADIVPVTLDAAGVPRPELFLDDDLHLTERGYLVWSRLVKPIVRQAETRYRALRGCARCGSQR